MKKKETKIPILLLSISFFIVVSLFNTSKHSNTIVESKKYKSPPIKDEYILGDMNQDGRISLNDIIILLKKYLNIENLSIEDKKIGDINQDGRISLNDIILLLKKYLGINEQEATYTVTFNSDGGSFVDSQTVTKGEKINKPDNPTKNDYIFKEWQLDNTTYDFNTPVTKSITLKAKWEALPVDSSNIIEAYFLNTQTSTYQTNESIILKTYDNKIIMIDTADDNNIIWDNIKEQIKNIAGSNNIVIDYLIISHSHSDHYGNLNKILKNDEEDIDITVNNIIYKQEILSTTVNKIINNNQNDNTNIIETNGLNKTNITYEINDNISLTLFNLKDIYINKNNCNQTYYSIKFSAIKNRNTYLKQDNQYIYIDNLDYNINSLSYTQDSPDNNNLLAKIPNKKYYAFASKRSTLCNSNANSIAVLVEIKTNNDNKYIYIPSDLENNGYPFFGANNNSALSQGFIFNKIYSSGTTYIYDYSNEYNGENDANNIWTINNNFFVDTKETIKIASESRTAVNIRNYIGENNLKNIIIYQETHHGFNNAKDAIDTLNINRSDVYSIVMGIDNGHESNDALLARGYHYTLNKTKIFATGDENNNGVYCYISTIGKYSCDKY